MSVRRLHLAIPDDAVPAVTAAVHDPDGPAVTNVLLAPGAGGDLDGAPMVALAGALAAEGHRVVRVNLPYREAGRAGAPRAERSVPGYRAILEAARAELDPHGRWISGGKSYGGRVATMAVAEGMEVAGLILYGYPMHAPGKPDRLRVGHWPEVDAPCLFLQGTRDTFGSVQLLEEHRRLLPRRSTVHVVEGGDHSLHVTGKAAPDGRPRKAEQVVADLGPVVSRWIDDLAER
ncbi:MAG: dienelactone hydrolase [Actinobacteria bacterium]|nr:dienelactone hydrolase [Actinomycetota bacterium]